MTHSLTLWSAGFCCLDAQLQHIQQQVLLNDSSMPGCCEKIYNARPGGLKWEEGGGNKLNDLSQYLHRFPIPIWREWELSTYLHAGEAVGLRFTSAICAPSCCQTRALPGGMQAAGRPAEFVIRAVVFKTTAKKPRGYKTERLPSCQDV